MASVKKRTWTYKGERKEAWALRYRDQDGNHRQETFKLKKQADARRREVEDELINGTHVPAAAALTVGEVVEMFLRDEEQRVRDGRVGRSSHRATKMIVDRSIRPAFSKRKVTELDSAAVEQWYVDMCRGGLAPRTAKDRVVRLSGIFNFAIRRKMAFANPVQGALRQLRGVASTPIRTFSPEQVAALITAAETRIRWQHESTMPMMRCFLHVAAFCGLRYGEIAGLTVRHVRFDRGIIEVRHSLDEFDTLKGPKTRAGVRDVPMPSHLVEILREWLARWYVKNDRELLFRTRLSRGGQRGGFIHPRSFRNSYWYPLLKAAGLETEITGDLYHFHALRHFASSWMIANQLPVMDVASLLGHRKFDTTLQIYAHPIVGGSQRSEVFQSMADRLLPPANDVRAQEARKGSQLIEVPGLKNMLTVRV